MTIERYLKKQIVSDLKEKMVFLGGPRQVGKTTLAKSLMNNKKDQYLNWDLEQDKHLILKKGLNIDSNLIILDEIHKYKNWRSLVKGYYDKYYPDLNILVTGSARLDYFRKGGDSLVGRYHYLRLHPLSLMELNKNPNKSDLDALIKHGGFPEPFYKQSEVFTSRWQIERVSRVITQDLRDLEKVNEISLIELLAQALVLRVGSSLSIKSLQEDLEVSPHTVNRWIEILENLYYCYRISPFGKEKMKAVKKAQKLYLWDWSEVESEGARFENLVASHLLKFCHFQNDTLGLKTELRYYKNTVTEKEIDFIVLQKNKPLFAVECKTGEKDISKTLVNDGKRLGIPKLFQVHLGKKESGHESTGKILPFTVFCKELNIP
jgi:hypothetical protein